MLKDEGSGRHDLTMADVAYTQLHEIAGSEFAIDSQIEECEISASIGDLESYANRPYLFEFEWGLLTHKLSLVPWLASRIGNVGIHVWLLSIGAFSLRFRRLEAIQTRMLPAEAHSRFPAQKPTVGYRDWSAQNRRSRWIHAVHIRTGSKL